jgi:hypothetical protein
MCCLATLGDTVLVAGVADGRCIFYTHCRGWGIVQMHTSCLRVRAR